MTYDPTDRMYDDEIRAESYDVPTAERLRLRSNKEAINGLKHAVKPDCEPNALRIRLVYSQDVVEVSYHNGQRHERIRKLEGQSMAFDTMQEAYDFLSVDGRKWQAIYWFEDKTVNIVPELARKLAPYKARSQYRFTTANQLRY